MNKNNRVLLNFKDGGPSLDQLCGRLVGEKDLTKSYRLRHKVFSEELKWVQENADGLEVDKYDIGSLSFGVFDQKDRILSSLRLITSESIFMLEDIFSFLIDENHTLVKNGNCVEITRLCCDVSARKFFFKKIFGKISISHILYKSLYQWCKAEGVQFLYMVVEYKIFRLLNLSGFPCELMGKPNKMPDGVSAVAAALDWDKFDDLCKKINVGFYDWMNSPESVNTQLHQWQSQLQLLETG